MALVGQGSFHSPMFFRPLRSLDSLLPQSEAVVVDLDRRMRAKLASSLAHIFDRTASMLGVEDVDLRTLLSEIAAHRQAPWVFASYFELVFAATFVCARLYLSYRRLLERRPESLNGFDTRAIERKMAGLASRFDDGARLIADKASLTPLGEKVLRSTVDYMSHDA
jgi:hypothetical protein